MWLFCFCFSARDFEWFRLKSNDKIDGIVRRPKSEQFNRCGTVKIKRKLKFNTQCCACPYPKELDWFRFRFAALVYL